MHSEFFTFLILFLFGVHFRSGYEMLKKMGKMNGESRIVFAAVFAAMTLMWASWFAMCPVDPVRVELPGAIRWIGFGIEAAGLVLALAALIQLRGLENIRRLVTSGVFTKLRHPMYLGFVSWIVGCALYYGAVVSFAAGIVGIVNIIYWGKLENARLQAAYGDEYLRYRSRTWF